MEKKTSSLDSFFERIFVTKAPVQLPAGVKEWIVKYSPWITLLILILMAPAILASIGLGTLFGGLSFFGGLKAGVMYYVSLIAGIIEIVLLIMALPGLFKRKISAWRLVYYSSLLSITIGIISDIAYLAFGSLIVGLISAAISLFFVYQIKSKYS